MQKLAIIIVMLLVVLVNKVFACSVSVNDNFQKNLLAAYGASHLDIALSTVSDTDVEDYARTFDGVDPYECPLYLETSARVSFQYSPKKFENCDASVVVHHRQYMGSVAPTGPIDELTYSEMTAACSTSLPRPVPLPRPLPRPCIPGVNCR